MWHNKGLSVSSTSIVVIEIVSCHCKWWHGRY